VEALTAVIDAIPGAEIVGCSSHAEEATGEIERLKPDVATLDFHLVSGNGHDVLRAIRTMELPNLVAIVFSNENSRKFRSGCLSLGAHHVFNKAREFHLLDDLLRALVLLPKQ